MIDRTTLTIRVRNVSGRTSNLFSTSHIKSDATNEMYSIWQKQYKHCSLYQLMPGNKKY